MSKPDSTAVVVVVFLIGLLALLAAWKSEGIQYGVLPPRDAPLYPLTKTGRVCLFLIGLVLIGRAILDIVQRTH